MSAEASVAVDIMDLVELVASLRDLHREYRQAREMQTSDGKTHSVEVVFKDAAGRDVGLQKSGDGYRVISDWQGLSDEQTKKQNDSIQQVVQRYAYRKVIKELQAQGYMVAEEEKRADQTIRLVVRKWS
jgi:hypothetical protein